MAEVAPAGSARSGLVALALALGWAAVAVAAVGALFGRTWPVSLTVHFWVQLAVVCLLTAVLAAARRRWLSAAVHLATTAALIVATAPPGWSHDAAAEDTPDLTVLFANVERANDDHAAVVALVQSERPDVVGLAEVDDVWMAGLAILDVAYPHRIVQTRSDNFGIALLSRYPLEGGIEQLSGVGLPSVVATVATPTGPIRVVVTHPPPPASGRSFAIRNRTLTVLAGVVGRPGPTVVLGDLNATRWSPPVRDFLEGTGLSDAARGLRAWWTWPAGVAPLALGLDHCFHSADLLAVRYEVHPGVGSDHRPVSCAVRRPLDR